MIDRNADDLSVPHLTSNSSKSNASSMSITTRKYLEMVFTSDRAARLGRVVQWLGVQFVTWSDWMPCMTRGGGPVESRLGVLQLTAHRESHVVEHYDGWARQMW